MGFGLSENKTSYFVRVTLGSGNFSWAFSLIVNNQQNDQHYAMTSAFAALVGTTVHSLSVMRLERECILSAKCSTQVLSSLSAASVLEPGCKILPASATIGHCIA